MKFFLGVLLVLFGLCVGAYCGLYWGFVGGVALIIDQFRAVDPNSTMIAWGLLRAISTGFIFWVSAMIFILPGFYIMDNN